MRNKTNWYKLALQLSVLALVIVGIARTLLGTAVDAEAYCPFGGLQAFMRFSDANSLACTMTIVQIFMGMALLLAVVLFSKLFCANICPVGTVTEWLGKLGDKLKVRKTLSGIPDRVLRVLKYALLFYTVYLTVKSGELFCKAFDPYYASVTGFGHDSVWYYGIATIVLTFVGAIFIRQLWCKYLCPLGALSNIFSQTGFFLGVIVAFVIARLMGVEISYVWPLAVCCIGGMLFEVVGMKRSRNPLFAVKRCAGTCTSCKLCDKACPQGIKVSEAAPAVKHVDCTLCSACVSACPQKETLTIHSCKKSSKWLPALATVLIIGLGFYLSTTIEIPTINEKWGSPAELEKAAVLIQDKMDHVKCYGSSKAFANQLNKVKGVLGVATYVGKKTVKIYYNPDQISEADLQKAIFAPYHQWVKRPKDINEKVLATTIGVYRLYGRNDFTLFGKMLQSHEGVYGFETLFGEPVNVKIFYNPTVFDVSTLKAIVEAKEVTYEEVDANKEKKEVTAKIDFEYAALPTSIDTITVLQIEQSWFKPYESKFNSKSREEAAGQVKKYVIPMPEVRTVAMGRNLPYLSSHLSFEPGIVSITTRYVKEYPEAVVEFVPTLITPEKILEKLRSKVLTTRQKDGSNKDVDNPYAFEAGGYVEE